LFLAIWLAGSLGELAILPYALEVQQRTSQDLPISLPVLIILSFVQGSLLLAAATGLGLFFATRAGFQFPVFQALLWLNTATISWAHFVLSPLAVGALTAVVIALADWLFGQAGAAVQLAQLNAIAVWKRFLAAIYGGISEEIIMRLFLMSMFVWVLARLTGNTAPLTKSGLVWTANGIVALGFGLGHLPVTATVVELTPLIVARGVVLNGIAGLVFGWLYWKRGLAAAMVAHFAADIVILITLPATFG
jgi:membrane protease YdiL (CAAX protease family)